ncbi:E3 ubiquitin-protein ligase UBR2-like isoform X2 [Halichondria panicea]|uniref:E3 ubiquitin-protein ligase UBR2-like isoform X2 n=1 Tax=Halichondria panicea TaxID=6063 RepID=UPI00312BB083
MERNKVYRELAAVSPEALPAKLHSLLADSAIQVFHRGRSDQNSAPSDELVAEHLTLPLQWLLCAGDPATIFAGLEQSKSPSGFCGKVFKSGEPAYFCKDCQTDPTCCLCMECFEHSEHKNHRYRFFASGGGGCCDCGDPEAWKSDVYCDLHQPTQQLDDQEDPVAALSSDLAERAWHFLSTLLSYCMNIMTWTGPEKLPPSLITGLTAQSLQKDAAQMFLENDEIHSFDEVIHTLVHSVGLTHTGAVSMATHVDRKGRAVVQCGTEAECTRVREALNANLANNPLKVTVLHEAVVAHQNTAILCLSIAKDLSERSPAFSRLLSMSLCEGGLQSHESLLDKFFISDSQLWINARVAWHRLVMSSVFMDPVYKKQLAIILANNYTTLQRNFLADSQDHDVCATNITVQIFTVPSLSRMLVLEHGLLKTILSTLLELLRPCVDCTPPTPTYKFDSSNYKHNRLFYLMHDLRYVLRNTPENWTDQLRKRVLEAFDCVLEMLALIQNADGVKRRAQGLHVEREEPWEHLFNFSIVLQPSLLLLVEWMSSDEAVLKEAVMATLQKHITEGGRKKLSFKSHTCSQELLGRRTVELVPFDIVKDEVSIHQPLPRIIACLMTGAAAHGLSIEQLLSLNPSDTRTPLFLMEHCSRSVVMAIQVMAGMWKRNGYSVVNQIINYQFHYSREIMYDKDILMLQCMASVMDLNVFTYALIYKFRLEKWINSPNSDPTQRDGEPADDALRFFISEAEDFLFLLITIFTERHSEGVGVGVSRVNALRREIIHRLFINPLIHSQIIKLFRLNENENQIDQTLKEVAVQKRVGNKTLFELNPELESEYDPFYFHYNRMDHSKAHEAYRKRHKPPSGGVRQIIPTPPQRPPPFTPPFQGIMRFTQCQVVHRVLLCVLKQAALQTSKFWSDKLIHEALYLLAVMMMEEDPAHPQSLRNIALGRTGDAALLGHLEALKVNRRADEYLPLLEWILQYLTTPTGSDPPHVAMDTTDSEPVVATPPATLTDPSIDEEAIRKRKKLAEAKRTLLMSQMAKMQRNFLREHGAELATINIGGSSVIGEDLNDALPASCGVGVVSRVDHTPSTQEATCILCQEETKDIGLSDKLLVQAVYVQRSAVLRRGEPLDKPIGEDFLLSRANVPHGLFTGGCGHYMHADCWTGFLESKQRERRGQHHFFLLPGRSVQLEKGEFLCPLCQSPCNTVLPLLIPRPLTTPPRRPANEISPAEWIDLVQMATDLADGDHMDTNSSSVDPTFHDRALHYFPSYQRPRPSGGESAETQAVKLFNVIVSLFSQSVFTKEYQLLADVSDPRVCVAQWTTCAYTIASLERNARALDKFLLQAGTLSTRQMDTVKSLVRLGSLLMLASPLNILAKYVRSLTNVLLQVDTPPFPELPCVLELDTFGILVSLHYAHSTLYTALTAPPGSQTVNGVIPALEGITDQHLIRITAAAQILQHLLGTPPPPHTDTPERSGSSPEFLVGMGLQEVWLKYRKIAGLPCSPAPSPYDLYAGVQQHLYPFLESATLFFHCLSGVELVYSSDSVATRFEDLCRYLSIPVSLFKLFDEATPTGKPANIIPKLASNWCTHPKIRALLATPPVMATPPVSLVSPRATVELPKRFSDLVKLASSFLCPSRVSSEAVEDSQTTMMCLVCGTMICANSYCCQSEVTRLEGGVVRVGGFNKHARSCGAGLGMALWILEARVVLLDTTDPTNINGCTVTPPYLDEYGEADPGLRRGNPLHLNEDIYQEIRQLWFHHRIPERISKEAEDNNGLLRITWASM